MKKAAFSLVTVLFHLVGCVFLEALSATRIIWHLEWSVREDIWLMLYIVLFMGLNGLWIYYAHRHQMLWRRTALILLVEDVVIVAFVSGVITWACNFSTMIGYAIVFYGTQLLTVFSGILGIRIAKKN